MIAVLYQIAFTPTARGMLAEILDRRVRAKIRQRIDGLAVEPEQQGKPLRDDFEGSRSVRAVGQRYRVVYRVDRDRRLVIVSAIGIRKEGDKRNIYAIAARLMRLGLL